MSNPTTPFGWQMPENTALVTDLPADFEVFGQAVATDLQYLLGGTTGQVLAKGSATDLDFDWVAPTAGDIEGVTAGIGISGGGTSGTVTVTNSMATSFTTSGDLIQATGSGTFARLGTGTNGQYLTTNGTTNSWGTISAGGITLLSTTTLTGASTTVSSISQDYNNLLIIVKGISTTTNGAAVMVKANGVANTTYYAGVRTPSGAGTYKEDAGFMRLTLSYDDLGSNNSDNQWSVNLYNYTETASFKSFIFAGGWLNGNTARSGGYAGGSIATNSAITSLEFGLSSGTFAAGTAVIYGVK